MNVMTVETNTRRPLLVEQEPAAFSAAQVDYIAYVVEKSFRENGRYVVAFVPKPKRRFRTRKGALAFAALMVLLAFLAWALLKVWFRTTGFGGH